MDFQASWFVPCRQFAPVIEAASAQREDIVFGRIDIAAEVALAAAAHITSIPTACAGGQPAPEPCPGQALDEVIDSVRDLDMDAFRTQLGEKTQPA